MPTQWPSEEAWRRALRDHEANLRVSTGFGSLSPREIAESRRRIERVWAQGEPEWQAKGMPSRLP